MSKHVRRQSQGRTKTKIDVVNSKRTPKAGKRERIQRTTAWNEDFHSSLQNRRKVSLPVSRQNNWSSRVFKWHPKKPSNLFSQITIEKRRNRCVCRWSTIHLLAIIRAAKVELLCRRHSQQTSIWMIRGWAYEGKVPCKIRLHYLQPILQNQSKIKMEAWSKIHRLKWFLKMSRMSYQVLLTIRLLPKMVSLSTSLAMQCR